MYEYRSIEAESLVVGLAFRTRWFWVWICIYVQLYFDT